MAHKRFKVHKSLAEKLRRIKAKFPCLESSDALATLLLETFLNNNGYLPSKCYYGTKFEIPGKTYTDWINELKEARALVQYKSEGNRKSDFIRYSAGPLISQYINAEKFKTKEIASSEDITILETKIGALESRVSALETDSDKTKESMNDLYKQLNLGEIDPPDYKKSRRILALVKTQTN
jgi:hypothetical protein